MQWASQPEPLGWGERLRPVAPRRGLAAMVLAHTPPRSHTGVPGLEQQVWAFVSRSDMATLRGLVHALLEAEARPMDLLPEHGLPGRLQALALLYCGA
jgi:hypothetical protein